MQTGTVKFYDANRGYGFVIPDGGGDDVMIHVSNIACDRMDLRVGVRVKFDPFQRNGRQRGKAVELLADLLAVRLPPETAPWCWVLCDIRSGRSRAFKTSMTDENVRRAKANAVDGI